MSLRAKLLLLVAASTVVSVVVSVGMLAWLIGESTRDSFRQVDQERTSVVVEQLRRKVDREAADVTRGVESVAASEILRSMALQLSAGGDSAAYVTMAKPLAAEHRLDFLELLAPDSTIISSAHWPVHFGHKERWVLEEAATLPKQGFLKPVETAQGNVLGILCIRFVKTGDRAFYVVGGHKFDKALQFFPTPARMRLLIYSAPEQSDGELLSSDGRAIDQARLMPLIQQAIEQRKEISSTVEWGEDENDVFHAMPLPAVAGRGVAVLLVGNSRKHQLALERRISRIGLLIAVCGALAGVIVSAVVAARITRPLGRLAEAAAATGKLASNRPRR